MRILKFGGKSLSSIEKVQIISNFIKDCYKYDKELIIIVSAMGSYTDETINKLNQFCENKINKRELAVALSTGETLSSSILTNKLISIGLSAKSFQGFQIPIKCKGSYDNAIICNIEKDKILKCFQEKNIVVISGFQGINDNGEIVTLGRGGSDTTAAALGAIFNCSVELYSDFDGIYAGDPKILNYKKHKTISNLTMQKIALAGAKVVSSRALKISKDFNTELLSKSSSHPYETGSKIIPNIYKNTIENNQIFITNRDNLCEISIIFNNICDFSYFNLITKIIINENIISLKYFDCEIKFIIEMKNKDYIIKKLSDSLNLLDNTQKTH